MSTLNKPIRVLHVFGRLDAGGAESRTMEIYRSINREKVQFDFLIHTNDECIYSSEIRNLGGKIYSVPRFKGVNYLDYQKSIQSFFKEHNEYKIIHGHLTTTAFIYLKVAKDFNIKTRIAHARNANKDSFIKKYTSKLSKNYATHLFAVSELAGISEFGKKNFYNNKVKVIPNAIDAGKFSFNINIRNKIRKQMGLNGHFVIGHIGRFHPQKNHKFLLKIFKELLNKVGNAKLLLIGEGELREEINDLIQMLGLEEYIEILGYRSDISDLLQAMDLFIFPSLYEGLPGVILEAQASGLPCIVSNNITREVKLTNLVEFIDLNQSIEYWVNKSLMLVERTKDRYSRYSEIVKKGYDIKQVSKWYESFYLERIL